MPLCLFSLMQLPPPDLGTTLVAARKIPHGTMARKDWNEVGRERETARATASRGFVGPCGEYYCSGYSGVNVAVEVTMLRNLMRPAGTLALIAVSASLAPCVADPIELSTFIALARPAPTAVLQHG